MPFILIQCTRYRWVTSKTTHNGPVHIQMQIWVSFYCFLGQIEIDHTLTLTLTTKIISCIRKHWHSSHRTRKKSGVGTYDSGMLDELTMYHTNMMIKN